MNYTVCWKHFVVTDGPCPYCDNERFRMIAGADLIAAAPNTYSEFKRLAGEDLVCGFCNTSRPLSQNRCPRCSQWEQGSHSGRAPNITMHPAPSREDAHAIRLLLRSSLGYVPGVKWSRI